MPPQPHKVELDLDRKEELIIAKQLRACRVNIMPRNVDNCYKLNSVSPSPSPRTPQSPHFPTQSKVETNPIAMRYWNQCKTVQSPDSMGEARAYTEQDVVDELALKMLKRSEQNAKKPSASKVVSLPTVPDIRNKMKESPVPSSPKILITDTDNRKSVTEANAATARVLSTAGNGIKRENERSEAVANLNRFITVDQLPKPEQLPRKGDSQNQRAPPKLPFLNDIQLIKKPEPKSVSSSPQPTPTVPELPIKTKINHHVGHIENRPKLGDLPFLNDIRSISDVPDEKQKRLGNVDNTPDIPADGTRNFRGLPAEGDSIKASDKMENDILRQSLKSPSPKIVRFSEKDRNTNESKRNSYATPNDCDKKDEDTDERPLKPPKARKSAKFNIKIDEKTNMSKLSDQIIPQLNTMQKNYLGLLFFNELSQNIVEDIVAQQLSMMPGSKLASVLSSLEQQVCDTAVPLMLNYVSEDLRTALVCDSFGELSTQDKAGVLFTTGDDVMDVCSTIAEFGGRAFKKALIKNLINNEDKDFMDEVVQEQIKDQNRNRLRTNENNGKRLSVIRDDQRQFSSADEENYNSAEESFADVVDDEVYQYEYFDFENK